MLLGGAITVHSFPTRRSSDLRVKRAAEGLETGADDAADRVRAAQKRLGKAAEDRKSTRLNSSHVRISYAVFCLKKKNHRPTPDANRPPRTSKQSARTRLCGNQ